MNGFCAVFKRELKTTSRRSGLRFPRDFPGGGGLPDVQQAGIFEARQAEYAAVSS